MKHSLLSAFALAGAMFASVGAFAQWAEPVAPELNEVNAASIEPTHTYYIKNVGAGQFMTGGNAWATQISLTRSGWNSAYCPALPVVIKDSTAVIAQSQVTGVTIFSQPPFVTRGDTGNNGGDGTRTVNAGYFFRDSEAAGFVDHGSQDKGYIWKITKADNGYYRIQTAEGDPAYPNAANEYVGWDASDGEIEMDPVTLELLSGSTVVYMNLEDGVEEHKIDWMFIEIDEFLAQKAAYDARVQLYEKYLEVMEQAEIEGVTVDDSNAAAIYNNAAATPEDLQEAINDLTYQLNVAIFSAQFNGTADEPQEVTDLCLVNANFDQGNIDGWTNTFSGKATNIGYQGASYTNNGTTQTSAGSATDDDGNAAYLNKFIEAWRSNASPFVIGDAELSQTVYGLPAGMYKLTCDANAVYQWTDAAGSNPVTGVKLFIATDAGTEVYQEIATYNGNPEHFSITFVCPEGVKALTFGLKTESTTANWIAADNFRIYYYGESEDIPELFILNDQIAKADATEITESDNANAEILNTYLTALESAKATAVKAGVTAEECTEATDALKAALDAAQQSIKDYVALQGYIEEAQQLSEEVYQANFQDAADALDALAEEWTAAWEEKTATKEMIDTLDGVATRTMKEYIFGNIQPGTDITFLLENPGFTKGTTSSPTGWDINMGSLTELRASTHNIETYHKKFDLSQTLPDMPAGVYDITLQGFVRHDDGGDPTLTYLYGGMSKANLISLDDDVEQKVTEENRIFYDGGPNAPMGDSNYDNSRGVNMDDEGNTLYQCNGMTGAYYWFQETNPKTGELYYTNHVKVLHEKQGDLVIGIHSDSEHDWVIWDNFAIKYIGQDNSVIREQLEETLAQLADVCSADEAFLTAKATQLAEELPEKAQKVIDDDVADEMLAAIKEVTEAIDYVKEGNKLGQQLYEAVNAYNGPMMDQLAELDITPTDDAYAELLAEWEDGGGADPSTLADNEAVQALIDQIKDGWTAFVMSAATDASKDNPMDVTPVIYNPTYIDPISGANNATGWTSIGNIGFDAARYAEAEFFNQNFDHRQTIKGLKQGWYQLNVDGFYRAGYPAAAGEALDADTMAYNANIFAIGADSVAVPLADIFVGKQEYALHGSDEATVDLINKESEEGETITYYVPNRMSSAYTYFTAGLYPNTLFAYVGEDGVLTIGVSKDTHIEGDWTIFTNWMLAYMGDGDENAPDAVESIKAAQPTAVSAIYNLAGQKVSKAQKGIYIINGRKVVVK